MVGKTLKSKINGALFFVEEEIVEHGVHYYIVRDLAADGTTCWDKGWFENGIMQNLEVIEG